jgi:nucleotide-binding universal stress UspA family protein
MIKRIALQIEKDSACEVRTAVATALAARFDAELIGVYVGYSLPPYVFDESYVPVAVMEVTRRKLEEDRGSCEEAFRRQTLPAGIAIQWRAQKGRPDELLARHARCADLLIMSQAVEGVTDSVIAPDLEESVVLTAGRPVLTIPYAGTFPTVGSRILFCWDRGREAARALADAAPFLESAQEVVVLTLNADSDTMRRRMTVDGDLEAYFHAHGYVHPRSTTGSTSGLGAGNAILNAASDYDCDLIVMGLYGHSRAREWVLGGASRSILKKMTVPVLFSH